MVQPLTYNDIDNKIKGRILPISPSYLNPCLRTELWNQMMWTCLLRFNNGQV